jgi:hypothetical protein
LRFSHSLPRFPPFGQRSLSLPLAPYAVAICNGSFTSIPAVAATAKDLAFALRFQGHKRVLNAGEIVAEIVAKRLVEHLERAGYVVTKATARDPRGTGEGFQR